MTSTRTRRKSRKWSSWARQNRIGRGSSHNVEATPGTSGTLEQYYGTGRRKKSIARVFLRPGQGIYKINGQELDAYFKTPTMRAMVRHPLAVVEMTEKFDVLINTSGGGNNGQAGAARLGISRALLRFNPELRGALKKMGFLTRDSRAKERKKYGQKGARKRFQFSKR
ncbi:MAG: 30S ribosomal protein S9 [Acidobacteria bacterium]|nr:30S ribosomal protein S9 [Acidobacteriota bacterium]